MLQSETVAVAMSGGVDSSVAALILKDQGYKIFGVTMDTGAEGISNVVEDARQAAGQLGIDHFVINVRKEFVDRVIEPFCESYLQGRTPNPCVVCNRYIKFGRLLDAARDMGAEFIATGHYVRKILSGSEYQLFTGLDPAKDQSYVLYSLNQDQVAHSLFPLGGLTKREVRELAVSKGFLAAQRGESQEICFVTSDNYGGFVEKNSSKPVRPGIFCLADGSRVGNHQGIHRFTIGQRKGLGIALGEPVYVTGIDHTSNTVWLGRNDDLFRSSLTAVDVNYLSGRPFLEPTRISAKIRYAAARAEAMLLPLTGNSVRIQFERPQRAITPGQAVVFYHHDQLLGGGTIDFAE